MAQVVVLAEEVVAQELVYHLVLLAVVVSWHERSFEFARVLVVVVPEVMPVALVPEIAPVVPVLAVVVVRHVVEDIDVLVQFSFCVVLAQIRPPAFVVRQGSDRGPLEQLLMPAIAASGSVVMVVTFGCSLIS